MPTSTENCCAAKVTTVYGNFVVGSGSAADKAYQQCVNAPTGWGCGLPGLDNSTVDSCCRAWVLQNVGSFQQGDGSNADKKYADCQANPANYNCSGGTGTGTTPPAGGGGTGPGTTHMDPICVTKCQAFDAANALNPLMSASQRVSALANCLAGCGGGSPNGNPGTPAPGTPPNSTCPQCGATNISACISCFAQFAIKGAEVIAANILLSMLVLLGIYLLFRPRIDATVQTGVAAAKRAGEDAVAA